MQTIPEDNIDVFATVILFVFFFFPAIALYVIHPLRESISNVKQLQRMTGISCFTYWGSMFAFDFIVFLTSIFSIVIGLICMDKAVDLKMYEEKEIGKLYIHSFFINSYKQSNLAIKA